MWNSSGVKELYDSTSLDESIESHKDKVIEMLSPHLNFMTDNELSLENKQKFSKEEEERRMYLNMKKHFLMDEEEKMIVRVVSKFADLGYQVTRNSVLEVINDIIERKLEQVGVGSRERKYQYTVKLH